MPLEKRDKQSGARLFIPTPSERSLIESKRKLDEGMKEIETMKAELKSLIEELKDK